MKMLDPNKLSAKELVFNRKKFYSGRAIELQGVDGEGDPVEGTFLIQAVKMDRLFVIDSTGRESDFDIVSFLEEVEGDETYPPSMHVKFFGEDRYASSDEDEGIEFWQKQAEELKVWVATVINSYHHVLTHGLTQEGIALVKGADSK